MKKVLFLTPSLGMGGMERVLVNYANLFSRRGYDVTVKNLTYDDEAIVSAFDPAVHYEKDYRPVKNLFRSSLREIVRGNFRLLPWKTWLKVRSARYLYKKYVTEEYDIEIAFFGSETIKIVSGSTNERAVRIGWIHNVNLEDDVPPLGSYQKAKKVYSEIETLICVSEASKARVGEFFGRTDGVYAVNNPNDTVAIRKRAAEGTPPEKKNFTFVNISRMDDHQKGFLRLFPVLRKLLDEGFAFSLWVVGDGIDFERIQNAAKEEGLSDCVTFFGKQANPYPYLRAADMYLSASYFEGFSMVMMEAVILAKPMLSTDVSGARDMLGDSEYGLVVENSAEGLYAGMKQILSDPALFEHYQKKAEERKDYLSEENIMDQVEKIIHDTRA